MVFADATTLPAGVDGCDTVACRLTRPITMSSGRPATKKPTDMKSLCRRSSEDERGRVRRPRPAQAPCLALDLAGSDVRAWRLCAAARSGDAPCLGGLHLDLRLAADRSALSRRRALARRQRAQGVADVRLGLPRLVRRHAGLGLLRTRPGYRHAFSERSRPRLTVVRAVLRGGCAVLTSEGAQSALCAAGVQPIRHPHFVHGRGAYRGDV